MAAHHVVDDDRINFNSGHAGTAAGDGAHHVDATAGTDDGEVAARAQHIDYRRGGRHETFLPVEARLGGNAGMRRRGRAVLVPVGRVDVHDGSGGVGVNYHVLAAELGIDLDARD